MTCIIFVVASVAVAAEVEKMLAWDGVIVVIVGGGGGGGGAKAEVSRQAIVVVRGRCCCVGRLEVDRNLKSEFVMMT